MVDVMSVAEKLRLPRCLDWEGCRGREVEGGYEWPCGLEVEGRMVGEFLTCMGAAHREHHVRGHGEAPKLVARLIYSNDGLSVTIAVSCGCGEVLG